MTTLHVRIGASPDRTGLEETLDALDGGDDVEAGEPTLTVADLETFGRVFRPTNLELLEAIADHEPESLRELARLVDRHPPEVNENVAELVDYGLVELQPNGRAKRPVVRYDEIDVELPIGDRSPDGAPAPA
jgi:predicted transcriptional regulator